MAYKKLIVGSLLAACSVTASGQVLSQGDDSLQYDQPELWTSVNSSADDYAPTYDPVTAKLMFASERGGSASVYCCVKPDAMTDVQPVRATGTYNVEGQQRAFVTFDALGNAVGAVFIQYEEQSWPGIVTVLRDGGNINAGLPIEALRGSSFTSHPALSPDGTRLVFSSNRAGGDGQLDLWITERSNDLTWSVPVILSTVVNSPGNEITPSFISNDSLYYASDGYGGKGGYDVFLSVFRDGTWQEPEPQEWLNSEFDESDATKMPDGTIVFASNRPGGLGGLDLYVSRLTPLAPNRK